MILPQLNKTCYFLKNHTPNIVTEHFSKKAIEYLLCKLLPNSSVIRQKGQSQNRYFKKTKHAKISGKQTFLTS